MRLLNAIFSIGVISALLFTLFVPAVFADAQSNCESNGGVWNGEWCVPSGTDPGISQPFGGGSGGNSGVYRGGSGGNSGVYRGGSGGDSVVNTRLENPLRGTDTIYIFLQKVLKVVADIAFPVVVLAIIYSGFLYIKAQGNETELGKAKTAITWSIVGGAIVLGAWVLAKAIEGTISVL